MKKLLIGIIAGLLLVQNAFALQQIAGPLVITSPIGGSSSAQYGLINDENETITISLKAEGDVAKYLSFPQTVDLPSKEVIYTDIIANIPADYNLSLGKNVTGFVYALQQGKPGQVQVNIQMKKNVTVTPYENELKQSPSITGFALLSQNSLVIVLIIALIVIAFALFKTQKPKKKVKKTRR